MFKVWEETTNGGPVYPNLDISSTFLFVDLFKEGTIDPKCAVRQLDCPHQAALQILCCKIAAYWEKDLYWFI